MVPEDPPGFQPIGSQFPKIVDTLRAKASTPTQPQPPSATTGTQNLATTPNGTGGQPGGHGAVTKTADLAITLAAASPEATDDALKALLPQSVRRSLISIESDIGAVDPVYGYDPVIVGFRLEYPVGEIDLAAARELIKAAIKPATPPTIAQELTRLRVLTKARDMGDDLALVFGALREELSIFAPDVVRHALRKLARMERFFPSLSEIRDQCQRASRFRWHLADALDVTRPRED